MTEAPAGSPATITVALLLAAIGLKLTDFVKYSVSLFRDSGTARTEAINGLVTLIIAALIGFAIVQFVLKSSAWGDEITVGQEKLTDLDVWSTFIFGVVFSAVASTLYDFKKAIDGQDTAKKPKIVQ